MNRNDHELGARVGSSSERGRPERHFLDTAPSVLDVAHELAAGGAAHGTLVVAERQTAGRGRQGRVWHSPPGGLWLAVVIRPTVRPTPGPLALRVGLAVAETLAGFLPGRSRLGVKWPNDLLLDGKKVGGVLCEARWRSGEARWVAVGVGINMTNPVPSDLAHGATTAGELPREALALALADAIAGVRDGPRLEHDELMRLEGLDALRGSRLAEPLAGVACGISADGALLIETVHGVEAARAGSPRLA